MSREIRFRCWDQKDKKYLLPEKQGFVILPTIPSFGVTLPYENCFNPGNIDEDCIDWADADLLMGRYELEQYTGLTDKNGKEIYEGDIVYDIYTGDEVFIVGWDKDKASFMLTDTTDCPMAYFDEYKLDKDLEVIGNVHESNMEEK